MNLSSLGRFMLYCNVGTCIFFFFSHDNCVKVSESRTYRIMIARNESMPFFL
uniref:Uncharacterized protein n=1 Tax=Rhizophora mucronata TaxID=61149 RepID=A0A2P2QI10_RHIMU